MVGGEEGRRGWEKEIASCTSQIVTCFLLCMATSEMWYQNMSVV